MNPELVDKALVVVGNPNVLINIVSRRVKQMSAGGKMGRPLIEDFANLGNADIALTEIIESKFKWELLEEARYMGTNSN